MIDIHCHILPGLDDGAKDMDVALEMCRVARADGIETLVATPHCRNGLYQNTEKTILPALSQLKEHLESAGMDLILLPGADIHIHPETVLFLHQNPQLLLGGRYFLLELPAQAIPPYTRGFIFESLVAGFIPIITHPERNTIIQGHWRTLEEWVMAGALVQVTAMSLTGDFGGRVRECALKLVQSGLAHLIASDAHSAKRRPPVLSKARGVLEGLYGPELAQTMVKDIPERILRGETVEVVPPKPVQSPKRTFLNRFFKRYFDNR